MGNWRIIWVNLTLKSQCWVNLTFNVESIWLSMLSQFDFQYWANLTFNVEPIWLSMLNQFDSQCWANLTLNVDSIWLSMLIQFDSQCWSNLTLNVDPIWRSMLSQFDSKILQLPTLPGRILVPPVTQLFRSKWLNFFSQWYIIACRHDFSELDDTTLQAINQDFSFSI